MGHHLIRALKITSVKLRANACAKRTKLWCPQTNHSLMDLLTGWVCDQELGTLIRDVMKTFCCLPFVHSRDLQGKLENIFASLAKKNRAWVFLTRQVNGLQFVSPPPLPF